MKHSPQIELANARLALGIAQTACPHWDFNDQSFDCIELHDCCYTLDECRRRVKVAKRAASRPSNA